MSFDIRLTIPSKKSSNTNIADTLCVQYDENKVPNDSCESLYDKDNNEVICFCKKQGLTVNIMDSKLSHFSRLTQFSLFNSSFCNLNLTF